MTTVGRALIAILCSLAAGSAFSQAPQRSLLVVSCQCEDPIGKSYVGALKGAIARNIHYREVDSEEGLRRNAIQISIVSMPLRTDSTSERSVLSIVCIHDGVILHQIVETCDRIPIQQCAEAMLEDLTAWESS